MDPTEISQSVHQAVTGAPVWDLHTHLYTPAFGTPIGRGVQADPQGLMLWGIDELLTYHYLIAEVLREAGPDEMSVEAFWKLTQQEQADLIWKKLFVEATPLSEACRGVVTTLTRLGLDPTEPDLKAYRSWFDQQAPQEQIDRVLDLAGVTTVTMTNDLFDPNERKRWLEYSGLQDDKRFLPVLRFDKLVVDWPAAASELNAWGYQVDDELSGDSVAEAQRLLDDWLDRMDPVYCAMSLPPDWKYTIEPRDSAEMRVGARCLTEVILPVCERRGLPLALMIGVTRAVNPAVRLAGDTLGKADVNQLATLCREWPGVQLLVTMLSRENQHELAVTARKFRNLTPFGCWWFLNNPSLIDEVTRMRVELLGASFIPQHSDCRVLEQLIYKWDHSRNLIANVLTDKYIDLQRAGWRVTQEVIRRDAERLLRGNVAQLLEK